jgi:AraC-like DNA-binding protein
VQLWRVTSHPKTFGFTYRTARGFGHSLLGQIIADAFRALRVSASLSNGSVWWTIHSERDLLRFELEHAADTERSLHNGRCFAEAARRGRVVRGELGGYSDFFVPVIARGQRVAFLVAGPCALARPKAVDILERWRWLTGRQGHPADPEFAAYLATVLGTLVLEGAQASTFEDLLGCLAQLIAGEGRADVLASRADASRVALEELRVPERAWEAVREMVDDRTPRTWQSAHRAFGLGRLGLPERVADHVLVGLTVSRTRDPDPVDEAIRRDALQRTCVELARGLGGAIAGQVGDHGVVFLSSATGPAQRKKRKLYELADHTAGLARRFDLSVHFGVSTVVGSAPLSRSYHAALGAAEAALTQGIRTVVAASDARGSTHSLRDLRARLDAAVEGRPELLVARFDRYLEAVALTWDRVDTARGHLEAGFERLTAALRRTGGLDDKSFRTMCESLDRETDAARTMRELSAAYRRAAADVAEAVRRPVTARHDRSLRRAVDFIRQHYTEPLGVVEVARVAGLAPNYFSTLFKQRERIAFAAYVSLLRVERAKQLLASTKLDATRVAALCGFRSSQYFSYAFRRATGATPLAYRAKRYRR